LPVVLSAVSTAVARSGAAARPCSAALPPPWRSLPGSSTPGRCRRACAADPQPACFDQHRPQTTGGVELPPFPPQSRPTFQQVVTVDQRLGRW